MSEYPLVGEIEPLGSKLADHGAHRTPGYSPVPVGDFISNGEKIYSLVIVSNCWIIMDNLLVRIISLDSTKDRRILGISGFGRFLSPILLSLFVLRAHLRFVAK
jgi:hypothetical protein